MSASSASASASADSKSVKAGGSQPKSLVDLQHTSQLTGRSWALMNGFLDMTSTPCLAALQAYQRGSVPTQDQILLVVKIRGALHQLLMKFFEEQMLSAKANANTTSYSFMTAMISEYESYSKTDAKNLSGIDKMFIECYTTLPNEHTMEVIEDLLADLNSINSIVVQHCNGRMLEATTTLKIVVSKTAARKAKHLEICAKTPCRNGNTCKFGVNCKFLHSS